MIPNNIYTGKTVFLRSYFCEVFCEVFIKDASNAYLQNKV